MEITSDPAELDEIKRRVMQLEIEREALKREKDKASKERLEVLERELADLEEQRRALETRLDAERQAIQRIAQLKDEIERTRFEVEQAQRQQNWQQASELQYGKLRGQEAELAAAESQLAEMQQMGMLLKEEVDAEDIAQIVARWTGIPVSKLLEGEVEKLLRMEENLHRRVVGQDEAIRAVANAVRRARAGLGGRTVHIYGISRAQDAAVMPVRRHERFRARDCSGRTG